MFERKCKIFIVDDHPMVRELLGILIHQQPDLAVCGEAANIKQALERIAAAKPDLAVVDLSLEGSSGFELIKSIKALHPSVAIIVLSMHDEAVYAERSIRVGALGYVMKRETTKKIVAAIRQVLAGKLSISEEVSSRLVKKFVAGELQTDEVVVEKLSDREFEVFRLLGKGLDTRHVAETLNISIKTVHAYCARIKEKLNLANAAELLREAIRWNQTDTA